MFLLTACLPISATKDVEIYRSVKTEDKKIALTFDDGPHPTQTEEILSILDEYNITATFFVVGTNVEYYPDIVRLITENGHEIGNHTYSHPKKYDKNGIDISLELSKTHELVLKVSETEMKLMRPPGGNINNSLKKEAEKMGYKVILWNIDTRDWTHLSPKEISENIKNNIKCGSIILFHDYIGKGSPTAETLKITIPYLISEGYEFVTVSDLISCKKIQKPA